MSSRDRVFLVAMFRIVARGGHDIFNRYENAEGCVSGWNGRSWRSRMTFFC